MTKLSSQRTQQSSSMRRATETTLPAPAEVESDEEYGLNFPVPALDHHVKVDSSKFGGHVNHLIQNDENLINPTYKDECCVHESMTRDEIARQSLSLAFDFPVETKNLEKSTNEENEFFRQSLETTFDLKAIDERENDDFDSRGLCYCNTFKLIGGFILVITIVTSLMIVIYNTFLA